MAIPPPPFPARVYSVAVLLLGAACLLPIWGVEFPPLQDYPQHLFLAHVNATFADPHLNWRDFYQAELRLAPYVAFYGLVVLLEKMVPVLVAGRLVLSCYVLGLALVCLAMRRLTDEEYPPWGTLLLFPLAFHQMYFMGFTNFLLSLPLLLLAVLHHQRLWRLGRFGGCAWLGHLLLVAALFLCHPYTILVYICLSTGTALLANPEGRRPPVAFLPPALTLILFAVWYIQGLPAIPGRMPLLWWPWRDTLRYFLLMFTGMGWTSGVNWPTLLGWLAALTLVAWGLLRRLRQGREVPRPLLLAFALASLGFLILPFWAGQYSYFNLRLAPVSYFLFALLAGFALLPPLAGGALVALLAMLIGHSAGMQSGISRETAQLRPLLAAMDANATLLPLTFRTDSALLDGHFFPEAHSHDYFYYHLVVGGGASPSLFPSPMLPVRFRPGVNLPLATHGFSWPEHGAHYDYLLTRGAPKEFAPFVSRYAQAVAQSGEWMLYRNPRRQ